MELPSIFLSKILTQAVKKNAQIARLSVGSIPILRIDDKLNPIEGEEMLTTEFIQKIIASFLDKNELAELEKKREITKIKILGGNFRFLVNAFYQKDLPSLSFRYIPDKIKKIKNFGFPPSLLNKIFKKTSGLFIIAGSRLSGKTTTAASIMEEINQTQKKHIITLEKLIEYRFINKQSIIEQRQIAQDVESFEAGLLHCLKTSVDVLYLSGEEKELAKIMPLTLEAASGNSLVILELNAKNIVNAITKILNALPKEAINNLSEVLIGGVAQKLIPKKGGGLALAYEVLIVNQAIKSLLRENKIFQLESVMQTSRAEGMITMEQSIKEMSNV